MTKTIFRCTACFTYTLNEDKCPKCANKTVSPQPARFSLEKEKKYSVYRRRLLKQELKNKHDHIN
jgi:rRNA maturation protein Nop10